MSKNLLTMLIMALSLVACTGAEIYPVKGVGDVSFKPKPQNELDNGYLAILSKDAQGKWYVKKVYAKNPKAVVGPTGTTYFVPNNTDFPWKGGSGFKVPGWESGDEVLYVDAQYFKVQPYFETYLLGNVLHDYLCIGAPSRGYDPCNKRSALINYHIGGAADLDGKMIVEAVEESDLFVEVNAAKINNRLSDPQAVYKESLRAALVLLPVVAVGIDEDEAAFYRTATAEALGKNFRVMVGDQTDQALNKVLSAHVNSEGVVVCDAENCFGEIGQALNASLVGKVTINRNPSEYRITIDIYNVASKTSFINKSGVCAKCGSAGQVREMILSLAR